MPAVSNDEAPRLPACSRCHKRKARCDKAQPECSSCSKANVRCVYLTREAISRQQDFESRQELQKLERRIRQLEAKNTALSSQLREDRAGADSSRVRATDRDVSETARHGDGTDDPGNDNEVASEVSLLSLGAGGERQFLGSASGLLLANLLHTQLPPTLPHTISSEQNDMPYRLSSDNRGKRGVTTPPELSALPPEKLARSLFAAYIAHDHLCYPFLSPQSLIEDLNAIYSDDTFYSKHYAQAFSFDMILAIGTAQVYKFDWQVLPDAETHHDRAMARLGFVLDGGGTVALQSILLLCQYRMVSSLYDTTASLWQLIGIAARTCFELGLHREAFYHSKQRLQSQDSSAVRERCEIQRFCFWSTVAMDRIVSIALGRPLAIQLDDIDTELPPTVSVVGLSPNATLSPLEPFDSPQWKLRVSIFTHILRYRLICGRMLSVLHKTTSSMANQDLRTKRDGFARDLGKWHQDTTALPLSDIDIRSTMPQDRSSYRSREWYNLLYQNGVLMLFRPSPALSDIPQDSHTLKSVFDAAQQSIMMYSYLHRSRKLNYSWITLHAVFLAGLSYVYAIRSHFQGRLRLTRQATGAIPNDSIATLDVDPTINQIVNDTRACSNVLVAVSERWSTARNCNEVFGRLTDAVLTNIIDFQIQATVNMSTEMDASYNNHNHQGTHMMSQSFSGFQEEAGNLQQFMSTSQELGSTDMTLQDCLNDLQQFYNDPFGNDAIMQLSQDWLSGIQYPEAT